MENITFERFCEQFKVRRNPVMKVSPYENTMLDLDSEELDFLEDEDQHKVWSLIDEEQFILKPGLHYRNVMGYFVCKEKWEDSKNYFILLN